MGSVSSYLGANQQQDVEHKTPPVTEFSKIAPRMILSLQSVASSLELLRNGSLGTLLPYQQRIVDLAHGHAHDIELLIENFVQLSALEQNQAHIEPHEVLLDDLVEEVVQSTKARYAEQRLRWDFVRSHGVHANIDAVCLQHALRALVDNAARFARADGSILVEVRQDYGRNIVVIEDSGMGIPELELAQLGTAFFRSSRSVSGGVGGPGIGFHVAKQLVQLHGGEIAVGSSDLGTTVIVQLPLISHE